MKQSPLQQVVGLQSLNWKVYLDEKALKGVREEYKKRMAELKPLRDEMARLKQEIARDTATMRRQLQDLPTGWKP